MLKKDNLIIKKSTNKLTDLKEVTVPGVNKTDTEAEQLAALSKKTQAATKHRSRADKTNNVGWLKMLSKRKKKYASKAKEIKEGDGLWDNIRDKQDSGRPMAKPGSNAYKAAVKAGKKIKANELSEGQFCPQCLSELIRGVHEDHRIEEAEYQGNTVKLNKPSQGDVKKFKVYVKNPKGNTVKINFGDKGGAVDGSTLKIKKDNPVAKKAFRARHKCDQKKAKTSAGYWSCKKW